MGKTVKFLFGMGENPRLPDQTHLSRAWNQPKRVYDPTGLSPAVQAQEAQGRYHILVSGQTNGTNMPQQSTDTTSEKSPVQQTFEQLLPKTFPNTTFWSEAFLAKVSQLLEQEKDLTTPEALFSLRSLGFLPTTDPDILYSKMYEVWLVTTPEKLSPQYLGFSPTLGMNINGKFLIRKISVSPKTESESSLLDILEDEVDEKYFLSEEAVGKLVRSLED